MELLELWRSLNTKLLEEASHIPPTRWTPLRVGMMRVIDQLLA